MYARSQSYSLRGACGAGRYASFCCGGGCLQRRGVASPRAVFVGPRTHGAAGLPDERMRRPPELSQPHQQAQSDRGRSPGRARAKSVHASRSARNRGHCQKRLGRHRRAQPGACRKAAQRRLSDRSKFTFRTGWRRQSNGPAAHASQRESACGEISVIYRFSYANPTGSSRLPATLNVVFPAAARSLGCAEVARRWLRALDQAPGGDATTLLGRSGALWPILESTIERIELNIQVYRRPAFEAQDFGTEAAYVIRAFRWNSSTKTFEPSHLPNQIDRGSVLCAPEDSPELCAQKQRNRQALVEFLQRPEVVEQIDRGLLDVPREMGILSRRAISFSPGGPHRSINQPFWNDPAPDNDRIDQQVISDREIERALVQAQSAGVTLAYVRSINDFRTRLNDSTCTGCHQTRAIAGFHFPGEDRRLQPGADGAVRHSANSVLVPGSPQFYGDQPRRVEILRAIAAADDTPLTSSQLAIGYSARPLARYEQALASTSLMGGWGSTCLIAGADPQSARRWSCRAGYACVQDYASASNPGIGVCIRDGQPEIGDPLQTGTVAASYFGRDAYQRLTPLGPDTRIPASALPSPAPLGNSYYGAHQEYYAAEPSQLDPCLSNPFGRECYDYRRDQLTGGFPSGMLRLSECVGLPDEATCGLVASSGFNTCISRVSAPGSDYTLNRCFEHFTSFAGMRACDPSNPCRDDYICTKPIGYTPANAAARYDSRLQTITANDSSIFREINHRAYDINDYGQARPDAAWVSRNDQRGFCIPPYFVFQFRADGHPRPATP